MRQGRSFLMEAGEDNPIGGKESQEQAKESETQRLPRKISFVSRPVDGWFLSFINWFDSFNQYWYEKTLEYSYRDQSYYNKKMDWVRV